LARGGRRPGHRNPIWDMATAAGYNDWAVVEQDTEYEALIGFIEERVRGPKRKKARPKKKNCPRNKEI